MWMCKTRTASNTHHTSTYNNTAVASAVAADSSDKLQAERRSPSFALFRLNFDFDTGIIQHSSSRACDSSTAVVVVVFVWPGRCFSLFPSEVVPIPIVSSTESYIEALHNNIT